MDIKDLMTPGVECVTTDASLQEAAQRMKDLDVGAIPVWDTDHDVITGIITDRDITVRATAEGYHPSMRVRDAMTHHLVCCFADDDHHRAMELMREHQIHRLPVLDRETHRPLGMLSLVDVLTKTGSYDEVGQLLEDISQPPLTRRRSHPPDLRTSWRLGGGTA